MEEESANALVASEGGFAGDISFYNNAPAGSLVMMSLLPFLLLMRAMHISKESCYMD